MCALFTPPITLSSRDNIMRNFLPLQNPLISYTNCLLPDDVYDRAICDLLHFTWNATEDQCGVFTFYISVTHKSLFPFPPGGYALCHVVLICPTIFYRALRRLIANKLLYPNDVSWLISRVGCQPFINKCLKLSSYNLKPVLNSLSLFEQIKRVGGKKNCLHPLK